jgi:Holliday junction resolvase RusA-like endonuclease
MSVLRITIPGRPIPWKRPGQWDKYRYDSQRKVKDGLGLIVKKQVINHKAFTDFVRLRAEFYMFEPVSVRVADRGGFHKKRPDSDNLLKFYMDLLTECRIWRDDSQVCDITVIKKYGGAHTGVVLTIEEF